jgi:hypothetical protein
VATIYQELSSRTQRHKQAEHNVAERRGVRDPNNASDSKADPRCFTQIHEERLKPAEARLVAQAIPLLQSIRTVPSWSCESFGFSDQHSPVANDHLIMKKICLHIRVVRPNEGHNGSIEDNGAAAAYSLDFLRRQRAGAHAAQDPFGFSVAQHLCPPFQGQPGSRLAREQIIN